MDIIKKFPTAQEVREGNYSCFEFEQELKAIRKKILKAESIGSRTIVIKNITPEIYDFLIDRSYKIRKLTPDLRGIFWEISWEEI